MLLGFGLGRRHERIFSSRWQYRRPGVGMPVAKNKTRSLGNFVWRQGRIIDFTEPWLLQMNADMPP